MSQNKKQNLKVSQSFGSPEFGYFYELEVQGVTAGFFIECINLGMTTEVVEFQDGDDLIIRKRPGRNKVNDIILRRPYDGDPVIWNWRKDVQDGNVDRKECVINCLNETSSLIARFILSNVWPSKLVTEYGEDGFGYELLTLTYEELTRES